MPIKKSFILILTILLSGCIYYRYESNAAGVVSYAQEKQSKEAPQNLLWYQGRDGNYDYFKYVYGMLAERRFRVEAEEIPVPRVFPFTSNDKKWAYVPFIEVKWEFYTNDERE